MKLTVEEYRRGLLSWNPDSRAAWYTSTTADPDDPRQWSGPLTDPLGSKVESPDNSFRQLRFELTDPSSPEKPHPVRWERLNDNGIVQTELWVGPTSHRSNVFLGHVPNYGTFHRLVVAATPYLAWDEDAIVRVGDVVVRLVRGKIAAEHAPPVEQMEIEEGSVSFISGWIGTVELDGRFIEIVAPGASPSAAQFRAFAVLGLLALCMGDHAVGEVVSSEGYEAKPGELQAGLLRMPVSAKLPRTVEEADLDIVDQGLGGLLGDDRMSRACTIALHWYERGIRASTPLDQLISYFVGIEALINAFAKEHGPIPEVESRKKRYAPALKKLLKGKVDEATYGRLHQALGQASAHDRFAFYVARRGLPGGSVAQFDALVRLRNEAFHGDAVDVDDQHPVDAKKLVVQMLKRELGIGAEVPWETLPQIGVLYFRYKLRDLGDRSAMGQETGSTASTVDSTPVGRVGVE